MENIYSEKGDGTIVVHVQELHKFVDRNNSDKMTWPETNRWRFLAGKILRAVAERNLELVNTRKGCEPVSLTLQPGSGNKAHDRTSTELTGNSGIRYEFSAAEPPEGANGIYCVLGEEGPIEFGKIQQRKTVKTNTLFHIREDNTITALAIEDLNKYYGLD